MYISIYLHTHTHIYIYIHAHAIIRLMMILFYNTLTYARFSRCSIYVHALELKRIAAHNLAVDSTVQGTVAHPFGTKNLTFRLGEKKRRRTWVGSAGEFGSNS